MEDGNTDQVETSDMDFAVFVEELRYWIDAYGLRGWHFNIIHGDNPHAPDGFASYGYNYNGKVCDIYLHKYVRTHKLDEIAIRRGAYHEVLEIMLATLSTLASERTYSERETEAAIHGIIRTFENRHFAERVNQLGLSGNLPFCDGGGVGVVVPYVPEEDAVNVHGDNQPVQAES